MADAMIIRESPVIMNGINMKSSSISPSSLNGDSGINSNDQGSAVNTAMVKKFKGEKIFCGDLRKYLYGYEIYRQASMLRKGREVHKIYVDVHKGVNFLDDRFTLTEFGKMVLDNGSVRAGRARNVRQIVVARETLYCSGTGGCKRACGGYGSCVSGCDKIKVRGHKCSFRVKLTMRLGFVDNWFVEILGSHNCYLAENTPSDLTSMISDYDGEDNNSLRSSPLSDSVPFLPTSRSQNESTFFTGSPNLTHASVPSTVFPSLPYPLNIPVFPMTARNAATILNNEGKPGGKSQSKPISPLGFSHLKNEITSSDMIVPDIINAFLPSNLIPRFTGLPTPVCFSPQVHHNNNGNGYRFPDPHIESNNDAIDLTKPRIKEEKVENEAHDLSMSPSTKPSLMANTHSTNKLNGDVHSLTVTANKEKTSTSHSHAENRNDTSLTTNFYHIPVNSFISKSPQSVLNSITLPSTSSFTSTHLSLPQPALSSSSSYTASSLASLSTSGTMSEKTRKAICKRLDNHFLGSSCSDPHDKINGCETSRMLEDEKSDSGSPSHTLAQGINGDCTDVDDHCELGTELDKDLVNRVHQLESHVTQLRNVILKKEGGKSESGRKSKPQRQFDFNKYNTRHVALKIAYLGWDYHGFVVQEDTERTIETALFEALIKTRLVESRETSNYHRCGRTDKGVSAFGQVISLDLRTNLLDGVGVKIKEGGTAQSRQGDTTTEIRYVHILNKVLPSEIRVLAWSPVPTDFSARFSCKKRTYKYFFPKGDLDIQLMNEAAAKLVGEHDYRNLCKMDVANGVVNFKRKILSASVSVANDGSPGHSMCELTVVGQAFLWHQIRCIVAVLYLIAQGKEDAAVLDELLDVEMNPKKPQYTMASELPLCLFDCEFGDELEWVYEADWHEDNIRHLQQMWAGHAVKATMIKRMLDEMEEAKVETESDIAPWNELSAQVLQQSAWLLPGNKSRTYTSLFKRQMCESLEERMEHFAKRRKVVPEKSEGTEDDAKKEAFD